MSGVADVLLTFFPGHCVPDNSYGRMLPAKVEERSMQEVGEPIPKLGGVDSGTVVHVRIQDGDAVRIEPGSVLE